MAGRPATLKVDILGDARDGIRALRQFSGEVGRTARRSLPSFSTALRSAAKSTTVLVGGFGAATAAAVGFGSAIGAVGAAAAAAAAGAVVAFGGLGVAVAAQSKEVKSAFAGITDGLVDAAKDASAAFVPILTGLAEDLRPIFDGPLADTLRSGIAAALPFVQALADGAAGALRQLAGVFDRLIAAGAPLAPLLGEFLLEAIVGVADVVADLAEVGAPLLAPFLGLLRQLGGVIGTQLTAAVQSLAPYIPQLFAALGQLVGGILSALLPALSQLVVALLPLVPTFGDLLLALAPLLPAVVALVAALVPLVNVLARLITAGLNALVPAITAAVVWLRNLTTGATTTTGPLARVQSVGARLAAFWTGRLVPAARAVWSWFVTKIVPSLRSALAPALASARAAVAQVTAAFRRQRPTLVAIQNNARRLLSVVRPLAEFLARRVAPLVGGYVSAQFRVLGAVISGVISGVGLAIRTFDRLASAATRAVSAIRRAGGALAGAGRFLGLSGAQGLATFSAGAPPGGFMTAALGGAFPTSATAFAGAGQGASATVINITVEGALDADAVARQIDQLLRRRGRRSGAAVVGFA